MDGIYYVTDGNNGNRFVQIDLKKYGELWEDFFDAFLVGPCKRGGKRFSVEEFWR